MVLGMIFALDVLCFSRFNDFAIFTESEYFLLQIETSKPRSTNFNASLLPILPAPNILIVFFLEKSINCCKITSADSTVESLLLKLRTTLFLVFFFM